ncbi:MAG: hypothetical protein ACRD24_16110, partial [Terriglobales bacterium]
MLLDPDSFHSFDEHVETPSARVSVLVDPDLPGAGEDHFAASLEAKPATDDDLLSLDDDPGGQFLGSSAREGLIAGTNGGRTSGTNGGSRQESSVLDEPLADVVAPPANGSNGPASASATPAPQAAGKNGDGWREEVTNRLDAYRSRRKRRSEQSLSLNFEQAEGSPSPKLIRFPGPAIVGTSVLDQVMVAEPAMAEPEAIATAPATAAATTVKESAVTGTLTVDDLASIASSLPAEELAEPVEDWASTTTLEPEEVVAPDTETASSLAMTLEPEDEPVGESESARFAEFVTEREFVLELPLQPAS